MAAVAIPFGLGIGLSLGMLGGGGSVLAVPVLVYILGQIVHQALVPRWSWLRPARSSAVSATHATDASAGVMRPHSSPGLSPA
jgi:uncharacterized membrane protein YfcA